MAVDETVTSARRFLNPRDSLKIHQYLAMMRLWEMITVLNMSHDLNDVIFPARLLFSSINLSYSIPCLHSHFSFFLLLPG